MSRTSSYEQVVRACFLAVDGSLLREKERGVREGGRDGGRGKEEGRDKGRGREDRVPLIF